MPALAEKLLTYRVLEPWEWGRIAELAPEKADRLPNPKLAACAVAQDGDRIVGFLFAQRVIHIEPLWVAKDHQGDGVPDKLWASLIPRLKGMLVFGFSPNGLVGNLLNRLGFEKQPWETYSKRIE